MDKKSILIVDDEENMRHMLSVVITNAGYSVSLARDGQQALAAVKNECFDFILCDLKMPKMNGLEFLQKIKERDIKSIVIMMSAYGTIDNAVEAMKHGAYDFITKPFKKDEVVLALQKADEAQQLRHENIFLRQEIEKLQGSWTFGAMVGENSAMKKLVGLAGKVARHNSTILITGESGTGKELLARGICLASHRSDQPFVAVNCGSIPINLLESEFFGYVKGAFTGADNDKKGLFEEANNGTLFLDEIGELPLSLQVKLLRVLQEKEVRPLGAAKDVQVDVRIIAATARDLEKEVGLKRFRQDLFFRINVIRLKIPPLRQRKDDIPLLCKHFLAKLNEKLQLDIASISTGALGLMLKHDWPGNIRELENVLERGCIMADGNILKSEHLPRNLMGGTREENLDQLFTSLSIKDGKSAMEKYLIVRSMEAAGGNKTKAAQLLEISYPSLLAKIKEYKLSFGDEN